MLMLWPQLKLKIIMWPSPPESSLLVAFGLKRLDSSGLDYHRLSSQHFIITSTYSHTFIIKQNCLGIYNLKMVCK